MSARATQPIWPIALNVFSGALLPAQFATNSALAGELHSVILTAAVSYSVGALFLLTLSRLQRQNANWPAARHAPTWAWLGGVVGSAYVVGSVLLTRALGAALAATVIIASQLISAIVLDHLGILGLQRRPINRARLIAVAMALIGLGVRFAGSR